MRGFWLVVILLALSATAVWAKPTSILVIKKISPAPDTKNTNLSSIIIYAKTQIKQKFSLSIKPYTPLVTARSTREIGWEPKDHQTLEPKTTYKVKLTSPNTFVWQGKKTKEVRWSFTTIAVADDLNKASMEWTLGLRRFLPYEGLNFSIERQNDDGSFTFRLLASFNAGIQTPIKRQLENYYQEIAQAKKDALRWIRNQGEDPSVYKIKWDYPKY